MVLYAMLLQNHLFISDITASAPTVRSDVNTRILQKDKENTQTFTNKI